MSTPTPRRRIELVRTAAAIRRGGASPKAANVDPTVTVRHGVVSTAPTGTPPTVGVRIDGGSTEAQLGLLAGAGTVAVGDQVLIVQLGTDLVVIGGVALLDTSWQAVTLGANVDSWNHNASTSEFYDPGCRIEGGRVWLRGLLVSTGSIAAFTTVATLPAGYRPARHLVGVGMLDATGLAQGAGRTDVKADGTVQLGHALTTGQAFSLDGISFPLG